METTIPTDQRIINTLLLNASFIDNLGLMHGKMGISIFFYQLSRQTNNQIYEDYAGEIIDEIYEEITINTPVDFENGLAGIGWGIEYLVQNGFIEADTDNVLEEFDNKVFKKLIDNTPNEVGILKGLVGLGTYLLKRIQNPSSSDEKITTLTNKHLLIHLIDELDRKTQDVSEIIAEPRLLLSDNKPSEIIPNFHFKENSGSSDRKNGTIPHFDLFWDYPFLLCFLTELHKQNIFNFKVEKMIKRLLEPIDDVKKLPDLHSNRLLLALAIDKIQQSFITKKIASSYTEKLIGGIKRETILSEPSLALSPSSLRFGYHGIMWIYKNMDQYSQSENYQTEASFWEALENEKSINAPSVDRYGIPEIIETIADIIINKR